MIDKQLNEILSRMPNTIVLICSVEPHLHSQLLNNVDHSSAFEIGRLYGMAKRAAQEAAFEVFQHILAKSAVDAQQFAAGVATVIKWDPDRHQTIFDESTRKSS